MTTHETPDAGPDLTRGVTLAEFGGRTMLRGHVGGEAVLLARVGGEMLAVGATCTHYSGPLDQGAIEGETVRCPLHHACFSLRTGEALGAPAFDPIACWKVEREGDRIFVRERVAPAPRPARAAASGEPGNIVIVGGGAAGFAAAEMLRRRGWQGRLTLLSAESDAPCDRPNLSKDYLAGNAPEEWIPLRADGYYAENRIDLRLSTAASRIDTAAHTVVTADGSRHAFDRLLIATGAEPVRLPIPGADLPHVFTLRALADSRAIIARAASAGTAVVLGSGFIGLEVAAALKARGLAVHVVSLDAHPLERVLGPQVGDFIRRLHEDHGETFHMGASLASIGAGSVTLSNGTQIAADLVVIGVGVKPRLALAEGAGLAVDRGIVVNEYLETSRPGIFAAGDVARWPGGADGETARVEHWVVAERQGQVAAENMLGARKPYRDVPFFWSAHHEVTIRYVGHAPAWDEIRVDGDIAARDCMVSYRKGGKTLAVATIGRDAQALEQARRLAERA
ncbi:MAG: 3-phenylpropionate/cinnamic acid dioxygenase ferredoxin--NAD(+) reductase component [Gammaproteobacteria bacterium]|nr:3-phenylpropionate/cinnamic acid dioxygenase ferredoxin--NAD(+) reductase component [Gammaproteobacteria bacterium]